jgi:enamine deaminase RidA (YjgF/YER057c/UK114 family)
MEREIVSGPGLPKQIGPTRRVCALEDSCSSPANQAFANLDAVLPASHGRPDLVVSTTGLVADQSLFPELNELYAEFLPIAPQRA